MKPLTIAFFGNTNNYPLMLAEGMSQLGHHVRMVVNSPHMLHRPESRLPGLSDGYPSWLIDFGHLTEDDYLYESKALDEAVHHLVDGVDLVVMNDLGHSLADHLKSRHIAFVTGSDLTYYASFKSVTERPRGWSPGFTRSPRGQRFLSRFASMVAHQRAGIATAAVVCHPHRGLSPDGDILLDELGIEDEQRMMVPMANVSGLSRQPPSLGTRPEGRNRPLHILCGARIVFRPDLHPEMSIIDFKGTDKLLKGFAEFVNRGGKGELRLPQKGQDLDLAKQMIADLGIENVVVWLPEMPLAKFYEEMIDADLICDQFGTAIPGMVTYDAYALARPVLADLRNEIMRGALPEPHPGFHVKSAEEIADVLCKVDSERSLLTEAGQAGRDFAEKFLSPKVLGAKLLERAGLV